MSARGKCIHGVERSGTSVWNSDACYECQEMREAYESAGRQIGGRESQRHREGAYNEAAGTSSLRREYSRMSDASMWGREAGIRSGQVRSRIAEARRLDEELMKPRPVLFGYMEWALTERRGRFTDRQAQALELYFGRGLSQRKAAKVAGCKRRAFRERLKSALRVLQNVLVDEAEGRPPSRWVKRGRGPAAETAL
jgi:hypothetical protein